jgi:hypothetical protein
MSAIIRHSLGTQSLKAGRFHNDSGFESLMAGMIHHSTSWGSLVVTTVYHILDHGSFMAGTWGFQYKELTHVHVAAREGTLGKLARYIVDRGVLMEGTGLGDDSCPDDGTW